MNVAEDPLLMMVFGDPSRSGVPLFDLRVASTRVSTRQT